MIETVMYQTRAALGLHDLDAYASCLKVGASTAFQMGSQRRYQETLDLYHIQTELFPNQHRKRITYQEICRMLLVSTKDDGEPPN
ncbi:MAG TPA: hypothetical protein VGD98_07025 [Ktedonobacteraceae bacterium]